MGTLLLFDPPVAQPSVVVVVVHSVLAGYLLPRKQLTTKVSTGAPNQARLWE